MRVGIGMVSRGEVGLILVGVGVTSGILSADIYTSIIMMIADSSYNYNHANLIKTLIQNQK